MTPLIPLPTSIVPFVEPYLPPTLSRSSRDNPSSIRKLSGILATPGNCLPFITLTYAQSLDSRISKEEGQQTVISHLETKTMTHYLRSKHDAILVGINTVLSDDPALNCRFNEESASNRHQIRPVIIDPQFKFCEKYEDSRIFKTYKEQQGLSPIIVISERTLNRRENKDKDFDHEKWCINHDITLIALSSTQDYKMSWLDIFKSLRHLGIASVMVEGGAYVINDLLNTKNEETDELIVDSLIVTIGPIFLGESGVQVSPPTGVKLSDITWWTGRQDSVLCAKLKELH